MKTLISITLLIITVLLTSCGSPFGLLGPIDNPQIASDRWNKLDVTYSVFRAKDDKELKRTFTVSDPTLIDRLKTELIIDKTSGLSIGTGDQLVFKGHENAIWHGDIVFEDTLYLSLSDDSWRSYKFTLEDYDFYSYLREVCAANEKKYHPLVTPKHIKLRNNLIYTYPKL